MLDSLVIEDVALIAIDNGFSVLRNLDEEESCDGIDLTQPFSFESACGTPAYTNFTKGFKGCLDYIFYQKDRLTVEEVRLLASSKIEDVTGYNLCS